MRTILKLLSRRYPPPDKGTAEHTIAKSTKPISSPTSDLTSVEEYLRSEYEPDAEYVDGVIEKRAGGDYEHSSWQDAILAWFRRHGKEWSVRARPALRVRVSATRYRVPDVTVLDRDQPIEQILTHPPLAVFEVLSPEDRLSRTMRRLSDFEQMGITHIWVVDPRTKSFFHFVDGKLSPATHFGAEGERIHFALAAIEELLD